MKSLVEKETPSKAQQRVDTKVREATVWHQASPKDKVDYFTCCRAVQTRTGMHPLPTYGQSVSLMRTFLAEGHASVLNVADCRVTSDQVPTDTGEAVTRTQEAPPPICQIKISRAGTRGSVFITCSQMIIMQTGLQKSVNSHPGASDF